MTPKHLEMSLVQQFYAQKGRYVGNTRAAEMTGRDVRVDTKVGERGLGSPLPCVARHTDAVNRHGNHRWERAGASVEPGRSRVQCSALLMLPTVESHLRFPRKVRTLVPCHVVDKWGS